VKHIAIITLAIMTLAAGMTGERPSGRETRETRIEVTR